MSSINKNKKSQKYARSGLNNAKNGNSNVKNLKAQSNNSNSKSNYTDCQKEKQELEKTKQELEVVKDKLLKALADYQNLERQMEIKEQNIMYIVKKEVFKDLISLFTDLYIGVDALDNKAKENPYIKGVLLILEKYKDLLKKHGVEEIIYNEGDSYDLDTAEIIAVEPHDTHDNKVKQTVEPGYKVGPYVLRAAKIIVYKKQDNNCNNKK